MKDWAVPLLIILIAVPLAQAAPIALDNTTLIQPTGTNITFKITDWQTLNTLKVESTHIVINSETLSANAENDLELAVLTFFTLDRRFILTNSTPDENLTINMTGLPSSAAMALYSNTTLVTTVNTNSTGGLNYIFTDFTGYVTLFSLQHYEPPPPPGGGAGGDPGGFPDEPTEAPSQEPCWFGVAPQKLVGTGVPGDEVYPPFTVYVTNANLTQNFTVEFDDMVSLNCFVDYSNNPNIGEAQPGETITYIIRCIAPVQEELGSIRFVTDLGCYKSIEVNLIPTEDIMTEIVVAFDKMSFGDIEGFLASKVLGISIVVWFVIALLIILIMVIVLSILVFGGKQ